MTAAPLRRVALALGALLAVWAVVALARRERGDAEVGLTLPPLRAAEVDSVVLAGPRDTVRLVRQDSARWRVNGQPAATSAVDELLRALADTAPAGELVAESPASHARLGVDSAAGRRVRVVARGRTAADLVAGSSRGGSVYLRRAGDARVYRVGGQLGSTITRTPDEFRDPRIGGVVPDSVAAVEVRRGRGSYALRRAGRGWTFAGGAPADSAAVASLLGAFRDVRGAGFPTAAQADSARFRNPDRSVRLLGRGDRPLLALVFDSTAGGFWVRHDSGGPVHRVDPWQADRLAPLAGTLRPAPTKK